MKANMGTIDRAIRAIVGIALIASWPLGLLEGTLAIVLPVVGVVLLLTGAVTQANEGAVINTGAPKED